MGISVGGVAPPGINILEEGLIVLFFGLDFSIGPPRTFFLTPLGLGKNPNRRRPLRV